MATTLLGMNNNLNEREVFELFLSKDEGASRFSLELTETYKQFSFEGFSYAWQHQQKRIDELECSLQNWIDFSKKWESLCKEKDVEIESLQAKLNEKDNFIKLMDVFGGYEKLQSKLNVAVEALQEVEKYADNMNHIGESEIAEEALAEINRLQDKPAEGE
jgi:hypothetical protein